MSDHVQALARTVERRAAALPEQAQAALHLAMSEGCVLETIFDVATVGTTAYLDGEVVWAGPMGESEIAAVGDAIIDALNAAVARPGGDELPGLVDAGARLELRLVLSATKATLGVFIQVGDAMRELATTTRVAPMH